MLSSSRNHGIKRSLNGDSPELSERKRVRPSLDIAQLSPAQIAVLSEAAAILQVQVSDLAGLPSVLNGVSRHSESNKISNPVAVGGFFPQNLSIMDSLSPDEGVLPPNATAKSIHQSTSKPFLQSSETNGFCDVQSFSLGLVPRQIADCFAYYMPETPSLDLSGGVEGASIHTNGSMTMVESSLPLHHSRKPLHSSSLSLRMLSTEGSTMGMSDNHDVQDELSWTYDCDTVTANLDDWFTIDGPYVPPPSMTYPRTFDVEKEEDLISFDEVSGNREAQVLSDNFYPSTYPEVIDQKFAKPSLPRTSSTIDPKTGRLIATPRRKFQTADERKETAQTRKLTACVRCRMQRIRCYPDPNNLKGACLTCQKVTKPTLHKLPCLRYKLTDIKLFREGSFAAGREWSHRWSNNNMDNIKNWASSDFKRIEVTQDYGPTALMFTVREFLPMEGDMLSRQWSDGGVTRSVAIPNYAIADMTAALQVHRDFIIFQGPQIFKSTLDYNDRLIWDTYDTAIWFSNVSKSAEERELIQMVLQLSITIKMTTRSIRITGRETLGMSSDMMDASSGMKGKIPIPPVLAAQMQIILNHKLQAPLRSKILAKLQKLTLEQKPDNWFCIYLCTFILLHNCSLLTIHDIGYAKKHGLKARHARPDLIKDLHLGANVLLAHFHYGCKGFRPFSLDWIPESGKAMATLDEKQTRFVKQTANYVEYNGTRFEKLLDAKATDSEHYFVAQMYEKDWAPSLLVQ